MSASAASRTDSLQDAEMVAFILEFEPAGTRLYCDEPVLVRDAATRAGVPLKSVCGGKTTCGKCLVRVMGDAVSPVTAAERHILTEAELAAGYRQACRTLVDGNVAVYVPPSSLQEEQKLQIEGVESSLEVDPLVVKRFVTLPPASLLDLRDDEERLREALVAQHGLALSTADLPTLAQLSRALRAGGWAVSVALRDGELVGVEPGDTTDQVLGLAVDLGTTKIACYLVDLRTGETLAARGVMNPQISFGEDVIARIEAATRDEATHLQLREVVVAAINEVAADICAGVGVLPSSLVEMAIVGNTAMHHLALGLPVAQLGVIPFVGVSSRPMDVKCAQLGLVAAAGAYAHFPPTIAGFVGSDHVAVLLAEDLGGDDRTRLVIDLGTNTEIALQAHGRVLCCSTACGPAFEGAHIRFGMRAAPGAIEHVKLNARGGGVRLSVIGDRPPVGICGSGIVDAVAQLLATGWLSERGALSADKPATRADADGVAELVLCAAGAEGGREVTLSQRDLGEIQLAKGAIRAGINVLLEHAAVAPASIDEVIIAGAFGTYLDPHSAMRIGLFPTVPMSRVRAVGNAAGVGARRALLARSARDRAARVAKEASYVELTLHPRFARVFAEAMRYADRR